MRTWVAGGSVVLRAERRATLGKTFFTLLCFRALRPSKEKRHRFKEPLPKQNYPRAVDQERCGDNGPRQNPLEDPLIRSKDRMSNNRYFSVHLSPSYAW